MVYRTNRVPLRSLVLMLAIWLLFLWAGEVFTEPSAAMLAASAAALALLLALRRPVVARVGWGPVLVFSGTLLIGVSIASVGDEVPREPCYTGSAGARPGLARSITLVALAPVFEEFLYRERLPGALRELWGWRWALPGSSALFALAQLDLRVMPVAFAGGLVCGAVMLRTDSLAAVIGGSTPAGTWASSRRDRCPADRGVPRAADRTSYRQPILLGVLLILGGAVGLTPSDSTPIWVSWFSLAVFLWD